LQPTTMNDDAAAIAAMGKRAFGRMVARSIRSTRASRSGTERAA
jgi:hypothetical protein